MLTQSSKSKVKLSDEQKAVIKLVKKGENVLVTGSAGTGKSTLLQELVKVVGWLPITGSTGISAVNVQGSTIHSWAGIGFGDQPVKRILEDLREKNSPAFRRIKEARRLAIDEISMIHGDLLDLLDELFQTVRCSPEPFGGIQMIFFGDFLQLPPVCRDIPQSFAFESKVWSEAKVKTCLLTKVFRQQDSQFSEILNQVRMGNITDDVKSILGARVGVKLPHDGIEPIKVFTHNANVDKENHIRLAQIKCPERIWKSRDSGRPTGIQSLQKNCLAPEELILKKDAQVMLLWNLSPEEGLANGTLGIVEDIDESTGLPIVRFANGMILRVDRKEWYAKQGDDIIATRCQVPLRLAYAITAHKCQGMTMDSIVVSLSKAFEPGQAYVALSRCRTLEGLHIADIDYNRIKAHPTALRFYQG